MPRLLAAVVSLPLLAGCGLLLGTGDAPPMAPRDAGAASDGASPAIDGAPPDGTDPGPPDGSVASDAIVDADAGPAPVIVGTALAVGANHACAIHGGYVWCWGSDYRGELGDGSALSEWANPMPRATEPLLSAAVLTLGDATSYALARDGTLWAWGWNADGQLGDGTTMQHHVPTLAAIPPLRALSSGTGHACGEPTDLSGVICWGAYHPAASAITSPVAIPGLANVLSLSAGDGFTCAVALDRNVYCWGAGGLGELGDGRLTDSEVPVQVAGVVEAVYVTAGGRHACAIDGDGAVFCWGYDDAGQLGNPAAMFGANTALRADTPPMATIDAGTLHTCGVTTSFQVWCWGQNALGQFGNGTMTDYTPTYVPGIDDALEVSAAGWQTCARRATGEVLCWGDNRRGQVGDGTLDHPKLSPATVLLP